MRRIALLLVICIFALCGCSTNEVSTTAENNTEQYYNENNSNQNSVIDEDETSVVGLWKHSEYPNAYSIRINSLNGRIMNLTIEATKDNYSQIATAEIDDAYFDNNKTRFAFEDSFNNSGLCEIKIIGDEMTVSYETNTPYQGGWCIDAGAGTYKKSESESSNYHIGNGGNTESGDAEEETYSPESSTQPDNMVDTLSIIMKNGTTKKEEMTLYKDGQKIQLGMARKDIEKILGPAISEGGIALVVGKQDYGDRKCSYLDGVTIIYCGKYDNDNLKNEIAYAIVTEVSSLYDSEGFTVGESVEKISSHLLNKYGENYVYTTQNKSEYKLRWDKEGNSKTSGDYTWNYGSKTYYFYNGKNLSQIIIHAVQ